MIVTKADIETVIPQRKPFIMIDNLLATDVTGFKSNFKVEPTNIFMEGDVLMEPALIENIAQTCAAGFGKLQSAENAEPKIGYIGSVNKLFVHSLPTVNSIIETTITVVTQFESVFLVRGENHSNGKKLVECEMKIVLS